MIKQFFSAGIYTPSKSLDLSAEIFSFGVSVSVFESLHNNDIYLKDRLWLNSNDRRSQAEMKTRLN
jgi:hypothetical protein